MKPNLVEAIGLSAFARHEIVRILAVILVLAVAPQVHADFGRDTGGTIASSGLRSDFKRGSRFTLSEPAIVTHLCAYLDGNGGTTGRQSIRFALYRDANGVPSTKVTETAETSLPSSTYGPGWDCLVAGYLPVSPGSYWIMIHSGGSAGVVRYYYDGPANWYGNTDTFADGSSQSFGNGSTGEGTLSVRALSVPQSQWMIAGRTTVASTPSGGLRADFKRGSSVVLPKQATLYAFSVYLDGLGGASGSQALDLVLYDDENGKPANQVWNGSFGAFSGGHKGRWYTVEAAGRILAPGRYWIVVHSSPTAGVFRYFAEGTGNWYGNVDLFVDGTSDPFGPAIPGDGTISAFLVYGPPFEPEPPLPD